ncbi:MAG: hypothetical protein R3Y07_02115 [Eubacteriales bacterium]
MKYPYLSNVDVLDVMEKITKLNTIRFQSDFAYDVETVEEHFQTRELEQNFYWVSRRDGTSLSSERESLMRDTSGFNSLKAWYSSSNPSNLYLLELKYQKDERIYGNLIGLHYPQIATFSQENALRNFAFIPNEPRLQKLLAQNRSESLVFTEEMTVETYLEELREECQMKYQNEPDYNPPTPDFEEQEEDDWDR